MLPFCHLVDASIQRDLQLDTQSSHYAVEMFVNKILPYIPKLPLTSATTNNSAEQWTGSEEEYKEERRREEVRRDRRRKLSPRAASALCTAGSLRAF